MQEFRKKVDVIVYTMGKVGSSTASKSIRAAGLTCPDVHALEPGRICTLLQSYFADAELEAIPEHIAASLMAHNAIRRATGKVKIVTLIRNPIVRNISAVFQNLPANYAGSPDKILRRLQGYATRVPDHWFEVDFIPVTGIDVFSQNVDSRATHYHFENDRFDVLLIKLETPDETKQKLMSEFLGTKIEIDRANEAKNKWYYDVYKDIVSDPASIRNSFVQECLELKYYKKFYPTENLLSAR
jgi:hypothetical protein